MNMSMGTDESISIMFQLSYRMKSVMLIELLITVQNNILYHYRAMLDFIENLRHGGNMKDLLVQILRYFSRYKRKRNF